MPTYEYRCNNCQRKVTLFYKTYAEYDSAEHRCPRCGGADLTRLISRVAVQRPSSVARMMSGEGDDSAFDGLDDMDSRSMGRMLREMSAETGEEMGPEFDEVVNRLERGDDPEEIEASMPDMGESTPSVPDDDF